MTYGMQLHLWCSRRTTNAYDDNDDDDDDDDFRISSLQKMTPISVRVLLSMLGHVAKYVQIVSGTTVKIPSSPPCLCVLYLQ